MADVLVANPSFTIKYEVEPLPPPPPIGDVLVASAPFTIQYSPEAPPVTKDVLVSTTSFSIKYSPEVPPPPPDEEPTPTPDWLLPVAIAGIALIVLAPEKKSKKAKK